jgi:threonylcarbamoyladenosine tRNA methylthiotransferase MtaB
MKRASFHTLGCKLNYTETVTLGRQFRERGWSLVDPSEPSDVFVLNTCTVTERADRECRQMIRRVLRNSPDTFVVVTGCYAQLNPSEIAAIGGVDLVLGNADQFSLFDRAGDFRKNPVPQVFVSCIDTGVECEGAYADDTVGRTRAYLKIQDGCDYSCTFCTIPLARGSSRSLPASDVVRTAQRLGDEGYREIVLTGVNVGDFGRKSGSDLLTLLRALDRVSEVERFRVSSIEPNLLSPALLDFMLGSGRFVDHFHIPLQSGSDEVLSWMKRRYTRDRYANVVSTIRQRDPFAGIGADVITGFPGETDRHFAETMDFIGGLRLSYLHVFTYSERENTPAPGLRNPVEPRIRYHRSERLRELGRKIRASFNATMLGRTERVLFETTGTDGITSGWTPGYVRVGVRGGEDLVNRVVPVTITSTSHELCSGRLAPGAPVTPC